MSPDAHGDLGIDRATLRRLAVAADADPRSVIAEIRASKGQRQHVRGMAGQRVRRVLREHGILPNVIA